MKSTTFTQITALVVLGSLLASCSATTSDDKAARLKKLKTEYAKMGKEISALEQTIAKENPGSIKIKTKEVVVAELKPHTFDHYVQTQGAVESIDNIQVSAQSAGIITHVFVTEGQNVSKGQILAQIDNSLMQRGVDELKSQLELTNSVYIRQKNLWDQKIGTEVQYLQAKSNKENLERKLASLNQQIEMSRVKSPINGSVDAVNIKVGENIAPGIAAFRVVNVADLKVKARVSEAYISTIKKGDNVVVSLPELDNKEITAKVSFVSRNIDILSRTFVVEIKLPSSADLRPNMTAVIKVIFDSEAAAITVPVNVVQDLNGEKVVYVAEVNGKNTVARKKIVKVDGVYDNQAQIKSGLTTGDKIITVGYQGLNDGDFIKL